MQQEASLTQGWFWSEPVQQLAAIGFPKRIRGDKSESNLSQRTRSSNTSEQNNQLVSRPHRTGQESLKHKLLASVPDAAPASIQIVPFITTSKVKMPRPRHQAQFARSQQLHFQPEVQAIWLLDGEKLVEEHKRTRVKYTQADLAPFACVASFRCLA